MKIVSSPDLLIKGNQLIFSIYKGEGLTKNIAGKEPTTFISVKTQGYTLETKTEKNK